MSYVASASAGYRSPVVVEKRAPRRVLPSVSEPARLLTQPLAKILKDGGVMRVSPQLAARLLTEGFYHGQGDRHKRSGARMHIETFAEMIRNGGFRGDSNAIYICVVDGVAYLVDGYHRCEAIVAADREVNIRVIVLKRDNMDEVAKDYAIFNRQTRPRTLEQVKGAFDVFPTDSPVIKSIQTALSKCIPAVVTGFSNSGAKDLPAKFRSDAFRFEQQVPYVEACELFQRALECRPYRAINQKLLRPPVFGVAVITLKHQPELALEFWSGVINSGPLAVEDPRRVLYETINSRSHETPRAMASLVEMAWRKWVRGETVTLLRAPREAAAAFTVHKTPYRPLGA